MLIHSFLWFWVFSVLCCQDTYLIKKPNLVFTRIDLGEFSKVHMSPCSLQPCPDRGFPYQPWLRLTWAWGEGLRRVRRETCLRGTPWAGRSSTSVARCCCHCYSKSLCLDHCGQRERQVRATQLRTAWAPTNHLHAAFGDDARAWFEEEGWSYSCIKQNRPQVIVYFFPPEVGEITLGGPIQN